MSQPIPDNSKRTSPGERLLSGTMLLSVALHLALLAAVAGFTPAESPRPTPSVTVVDRPVATIEWQKITPIVEVVEPRPVEVVPVEEAVETEVAVAEPAPSPEPDPEPEARPAEPPPEPQRERTRRRAERREREEADSADRPERSRAPPEAEPDVPPRQATVAPATIPVDDPDASPEESYDPDAEPLPGAGPPALAHADGGEAEGPENAPPTPSSGSATTFASSRGGEGDDAEQLLRTYRRTLQRALRSQVEYPDRAQRRGIEGTVVVEVRVDHAGRILEARVFRSSGHEILDNAVIDAMLARGELPPPPNGADWDGRPIRIPFPFRIT